MATKDLKRQISLLRQKIKADYEEYNSAFYRELSFKYIDDFLSSPKYTDLEKAFFLILYQFPGSHRSYIVIPHEMVLVPDVYDMKTPGIEYEIDFALYGGSIDNPVKVAIECDGIRSHAQKYSNKDRRKNVNLQAAGWLVMRFGSKEIHEQLSSIEQEEPLHLGFLYSIENTIHQRLRLIDSHSYTNSEYRSKLTGYTWGQVQCTNCGFTQMDRLNRKRIACRKCNSKFERIIAQQEKIEYEHNGLLYFK